MIECPECASTNVWPMTTEDAEGFVEYRCSDCGHYFVEESTIDGYVRRE